jgi:hypothetical protein
MNAESDLLDNPAAQIEIQDGLPVWIHGPGASPVTSELVRDLSEEDE